MNESIHQMKSKNLSLFLSSDGAIELNVPLEGENVWLSLNQMSELFERDKSVISRHIKKIFSEEELDKNQTVALFATVQKEGLKKVLRNIEYYSLDMVLSVGYRVNSKRGSEFRRWSNSILKQYILDGYALNHQTIAEKGFDDLKKSIELVKKTLLVSNRIDDIGIEALSIVQTYAKSWSLLLSYDEKKLHRVFIPDPLKNIDVPKIKDSIQILKRELIEKGEASKLFGQFRLGFSIESIFDSVNQTFNDEVLYPSLEERAAHILYFVIKNHPYIDGNKRIGSFLFLLYLRFHQFNVDKISNETLVTLALLVAQSDRDEKEIMIQLIVYLLREELV